MKLYFSSLMFFVGLSFLPTSNASGHIAKSPRLSSSERGELEKVVAKQKYAPGALVVFQATAKQGEALKLKELFGLGSIDEITNGVHSNDAEKISLEGRIHGKDTRGYFVELTLLSGHFWGADRKIKDNDSKRDEHLAIIDKAVLLVPGELTEIHSTSSFETKDDQEVLVSRSMILVYLVR